MGVAKYLLTGTLLGCLLFAAACGRQNTPKEPVPDAPAVKVRALGVPERGAYTGAYIDFGETEDAVTLENIEEFDGLVGKHQAIVAFSSYWGEQSFPSTAARVVAAHDSVPLVFWSPWDRPYREDLVILHGPDRFGLDQILAGRWDDYIDRWADAAKAVGSPLLVSLCNEMNGDWFPWSGAYYGGVRPVAGSVPTRYVGSEYFKRAYRYIVDRVRARGASNVRWVFQANNFGEPYSEANGMAQYYPGSDYVDWLALSVYGLLFPEGKWDEFDDMVDKPYAELAAVDPSKPIMLAEWGVGEFPAKGSKAEWITDGFERLEKNFPRLHAAVYWHERWQNGTSLLYSNLKVDSSPASLDAYRHGLTSSFWLDRPIWR